MASPSTGKRTRLCMVLCILTTCNAEDCMFPAIYNFGDSNSDTGSLSAAILRVPPPYGRTYSECQWEDSRMDASLLILWVSQYAQFIPRSQMVRNQGGALASLLPRKDTFAQALYTFDIGGIDLDS
ncbi:hypothetical protein RJ639_047534 [Escallonia herrerae]|uniref:Uncharacterized protein n=1 Tax=Escallonia herrerae TaxID=1293975 RepID=A0AA89AZ42_9ASTE|nr:hypothetical protein RJ639_047534 [Escallonia herrerae]